LFNNGKPGRDWYKRFKQRWKHTLSEREAENIAKARAASCTKNHIDSFFEVLVKAYDEAELKEPTNIWNVDETGFSGDQGEKKILCARGTKRPLCITGDNEKIHYTVQNCCNARGDYLPPMIIYKAKNRLYDTWCKSGPKRAVFTTSNSGWIEEDQFIQWLQQLFVPEIRKFGGKHVLILDGHSSHLSLSAIELCLNNNITMICLPAHSSHILQPLDVGVYGHVKKVWREILQQYYFDTYAQKLDKENFAPLLRKLHESSKAFTVLHAVAGFQNTGLYPINKSTIDQTKLSIAETFAAPIITQQPITPITPAFKSTMTNIQVTPSNEIYLNYAKESLELALKTHFQLQQQSHVKKSKKKDVRPLFDGQKITTEGVIDKLKELEKEKQEKQSKKTNRKLSFEDEEDEEDEESNEKCFKCKKTLINEMLLCENSACKKWFCPSCRSKRFKLGTSFFCCKKCRN
jgi:hypothetical protein